MRSLKMRDFMGNCLSVRGFIIACLIRIANFGKVLVERLSAVVYIPQTGGGLFHVYALIMGNKQPFTYLRIVLICPYDSQLSFCK